MTIQDLARLVLLGALWGSSYLFIRVGAPAFGPFAFMGGRVTIAAIILFFVMRMMKLRFGLRPYFGRMLVIGLLNGALPFTLIAAAELRLNASLVAVLGATVPLFVALVSAIALRERVSAVRAAGLALGLVGVAILTGWSASTLDWSAMLSVGAVMFASLSYAMSGIYANQRLHGVPPVAIAFGQQIGAVCWLALPAVIKWPASPPGTPALAALAALAILSTAVAFILYYRLISTIGPTMTSTVTYIVPAFGMLGGAVFLREPITTGMLVGFGIIAVSILLVNQSPAVSHVLRIFRPGLQTN
ncbi:MAG: DMT family transporter [Gemmatimonadaceae bacterium]